MPNEEQGMLLELRKKQVWGCFKDTSLRIGINGFRALGFHENKAKSKQENVEIPEKKSSFLSSFEVFMQFSKPVNGSSRILSKECFETWVKTRRNGCKKPEFSFRKALIAHCK